LKFDAFLSSRVARRTFALFVLCALVPLVAVAVVSFGMMSNELYRQGQRRLNTGVRAVGQGIVERLQLLDMELRFSGGTSAGATPLPGLRSTTPTTDMEGPQADSENAERFATGGFLGIAWVGNGATQALYGDIVEMPEIDPRYEDHMVAGGTVLVARPRPGEPPLIHLVRAARATAGTAGTEDLLVGAINPAWLWAGADQDSLPRNSHLCVFGPGFETLFCTRPADGVVPEDVVTQISGGSSGTLEWVLEGDEYLAAHWPMPLAAQFAVGQWTVMLSESKADVFAATALFRRIFPMVILLSLFVVLLLSVKQIRRSLIPLELLREGTRKLAARQFDSRVEVSSGDEFEELADSFNDMAETLGKQFTALATIADIDRTILSSLDIEKIVGTVLQHTSDLIDCHALSITLVSPDQQKVTRTYALRNAPGTRPWVETTFFDNDDLRRFKDSPETLELGPEDGAPAFLAPLARSGCSRFVVFPMFIHDAPAGAIALGFVGEVSYDDDDLRQARQLTDQVAVALSNAHLVEDLDALNWGALTALARAVDAKSPWTAGHSERVTTMGIKIGQMMKLDQEEIDVLHRGGLLHDVGKIGVPAAILDKPGKLTEEEYDVMKKHPEIGANILQPIAAYADVIPIVRQHHERWDGSGYPDGLEAEQIHPHARIFAVADVYDACASDRPYRAGMPIEKVVRIIVEGDGTEFDPEVVAAFLEVMTDEGHGMLADDTQKASA